jgi:hypothetical protein
MSFNTVDDTTLDVTLQYGSVKKFITDSRLGDFIYPSQGFRQLIAVSQLTGAFTTTKTPRMTITSGLRAFPRRINPVESIDAGGIIGPYFYPFALSFLMPVLVMKLVREKEDRTLTMMQMHGMRKFPHFIVNYGYILSLYVVSSLCFLVAGLSFRACLLDVVDVW